MKSAIFWQISELEIELNANIFVKLCSGFMIYKEFLKILQYRISMITKNLEA